MDKNNEQFVEEKGYSEIEITKEEMKKAAKQMGAEDAFNDNYKDPLVELAESFVHVSLEDEVHDYVQSQIPSSNDTSRLRQSKEEHLAAKLEELKYEGESIQIDMEAYGSYDDCPRWLQRKIMNYQERVSIFGGN